MRLVKLGSGGSGSSKKTMELIVGTKSDDFYVTMECGAEAEAKKLGVKLTVTGPATFSVPQQKPLIDAAEVTKPNALLVAPTDSAALDPDLLKVQKNGTKVIFVDTSSSDTALGLSRISSNNAAGGKLAADQLGKLHRRQGHRGRDRRGQGRVHHRRPRRGLPAGDGGQVPRTSRCSPSRTTTPTASPRRPRSSRATSPATPDLNGVFAANVITAEGAASGIQHAHKSGKIKLATFDADTTQVADLKNGSLQLAIAQEPALEGADAVEQGLNAIDGKTVTKQIATPLIAVTPQNMNSASIKPYIYASTCG